MATLLYGIERRNTDIYSFYLQKKRRNILKKSFEKKIEQFN